ncbi:hypothetical protein GCM10010345_35420 [Streptomyces canarius]|uniref:Uncharacterized protein n=1 Tax=Streptomyces canarius TaxID=285453 RepID=A0ABQ3CLR8_9ACTN|nr:hypothetical protein GCM10010345_35420 [Streptomyces canarius]
MRAEGTGGRRGGDAPKEPGAAQGVGVHAGSRGERTESAVHRRNQEPRSEPRGAQGVEIHASNRGERKASGSTPATVEAVRNRPRTERAGDRPRIRGGRRPYRSAPTGSPCAGPAPSAT